jgi:mono/diheme cytochrome c family protein
MNRRTCFVAATVALATATAIGCYTGPDAGNGVGSPKPKSTGTDTEAVSADLPCDVAQLLTDKCTSCHGNLPSGGAPNRMVSAADLEAASLSDPTKSTAELSVARMRDAQKPMPPDGMLTDAEVAILERWIAAGMPEGECSATDASGETVCTSNSRWTRGDEESKDMHPGVACIDCHTRKHEGPRFSIAGTVYPTAHEPDDCNGVKGGVQVVVTDADGADHAVTVRGSGNFYLESSIKKPYTAKVVAPGRPDRVMKAKQNDGDCNKCHTERGASSAPGRIMAP